MKISVHDSYIAWINVLHLGTISGKYITKWIEHVKDWNLSHINNIRGSLQCKTSYLVLINSFKFHNFVYL